MNIKPGIKEKLLCWLGFHYWIWMGGDKDRNYKCWHCNKNYG